MTKPFLSTGYLFFLSFSLVSLMVHGQGPPVDSSFLAKANEKAVEIYTQSIGSQANLYNGVEYRGYAENRSDKGHAYFINNDWADGTIDYDGSRYENVPLMYDLVTDKVILEQPYNLFKL